MADNFSRSWVETNHPDWSEKEEIPYDLIAKDYWDIVETQTKTAIVEYGNDLDTDQFMSGFPTEKYICNRGIITQTAANIGTISPEGTSSKRFDEKYYLETGWNLTKLPAWNGSVLQHITTPINGVNVPWLYVGMLFSSFCWHNEDNYLFAMNYSHMGAAKQWYGVPGDNTKRFEKVCDN